MKITRLYRTMLSTNGNWIDTFPRMNSTVQTFQHFVDQKGDNGKHFFQFVASYDLLIFS